MTIFRDFYADVVRARPYRPVIVSGSLWLIPEGQRFNAADLERALDAAKDVPGHEVRL